MRRIPVPSFLLAISHCFYFPAVHGVEEEFEGQCQIMMMIACAVTVLGAVLNGVIGVPRHMDAWTHDASVSTNPDESR
jgi:hypothetical protein